MSGTARARVRSASAGGPSAWCGSKYGIATLVERQDLVGASRSLEHIDRRRRDVRCMTRAWSIPPALDIGRLHQAWFRRPRMGSVAVRSC